MKPHRPEREKGAARPRADVLHPLRLPGVGEFLVTAAQAVHVRRLLEAAVKGRPELPAARIRRAFAGSPAWGRLVVRGKAAGTCRLARPPRDPNRKP